MNERLIVIATLLVASCVSPAQANPGLFVTYEGVNESGDNTWQVAASADPAFFSETLEGFGSSLAVELAFAVSGSTIKDMGIAANEFDWMYKNPGNNPFTAGTTFGTWVSPGNDQVFTSYGSNIITSGFPVQLFHMTTLGSDLTTVSYGVAASGHPTNGSIIAQTGQNFPVGAGGGSDSRDFTGYTGVVSSVAPILAGDYNGNGIVDAADYVMWRNSDEDNTPLNNETESPGVVDQADYDAWAANFGSSGNGGSVSTAGVPEPATGILLLSGGIAFLARVRRRDQ